MSEAQPAQFAPTQSYDTLFEYGDGATAAASTTWTAIAGVQDIKPPKIEAKDIDTTVIDSPNQFETFIPGWANGGEAEIKIQFDATQGAALYALFRTPKGFRIVFNDAPAGGTSSNLAMDGYIKGFQNEIEKEGIVTATITVKVSGQPVFTAAAGGQS